MRSLAPLVLLLCVGLAIWLATGRDTTDARTREGGPESQEKPAGAPLLEGTANADEPPGATTPPVAAESADEQDAPEFLVRGRVEGLPAEGAEHARVLIRRVPRGDWEPEPGGTAGKVRADATFEVDVTSLLDGDSPPGELDVQVDHPSCAPGRARFEADVGRAPKAWDVLVKLAPAVVAFGTVVDERGEPLANATVGAFTMKGSELFLGDVIPVPPLQEVVTDAEGKYRLRLESSGPHVIAAHAALRLPASTTATLGRNREASLDPLVVRPATSISGRALHEGRPIPGMWMRAQWATEEEAGTPVTLGQTTLEWRRGAIVRAEAETESDEEGRYELSGLPLGSWRVAMRHGRVPGIDYATWGLLESVQRTVASPASEIDLDVSGALLLVHAVGLGAAVETFTVTISHEGSTGSCNVERGRAGRVLLGSSGSVTVRVEAEGYVASEKTVTPPPAGEDRRVELELSPEPPSPTLVLTLTDPAGSPVRRAQITVLSKDAPQNKRHDRRYEQSETGRYELKRLHAGAAEVVVIPWQGFIDTGGYGVEVRESTTLPTEGVVELTLTARRGGRLRIAARNSEGTLLDAKCTVTNEAGEDLPLNFSSQRGNVMMSMGGQLGTLSPSTTEPAMPPGRYEVTCVHGGITKSQTVLVKRGETTAVDLDFSE